MTQLRRLHRPCPPIQQQLEVGGKSPRHRRHRRIGVVIPCFTSPPFRSRWSLCRPMLSLASVPLAQQARFVGNIDFAPQSRFCIVGGITYPGTHPVARRWKASEMRSATWLINPASNSSAGHARLRRPVRQRVHVRRRPGRVGGGGGQGANRRHPSHRPRRWPK